MGLRNLLSGRVNFCGVIGMTFFERFFGVS
jgi:hypothetical protein